MKPSILRNIISLHPEELYLICEPDGLPPEPTPNETVFLCGIEYPRVVKLRSQWRNTIVVHEDSFKTMHIESQILTYAVMFHGILSGMEIERLGFKVAVQYKCWRN